MSVKFYIYIWYINYIFMVITSKKKYSLYSVLRILVDHIVRNAREEREMVPGGRDGIWGAVM